jgi:hypothetical protein
MNKVTHKIMVRETGEDKYYFLYSIKMEFDNFVRVVNVLEKHGITYKESRDLSYTICATINFRSLEIGK